MVARIGNRPSRPASASAVLPLVLALLALVVAPGSRLHAQELVEPCVYTAANGRLVITDDASDPRCPDLRRGTSFRPPGRLIMSVEVAELIALAHQTAERYRVDHRLVESLVEMESGFNPEAVSPKGALGLMQLMPAMARQYEVIRAFDPWDNLDGGVRLLRDLLVHHDGDVELALAAYNAGSGAVERYRGVPPYPETQDYVRRVLYRYRQRVAGAELH